MIRLLAPYPAIRTECVLPNPQLGDAHHLAHSVSVKRAINGTRYSYVQSNSDRVLVFNFVLTRAKSLEFLDFIRVYGSDKMQLVSHDNVTYVGYLATNPNSLTKTNRAATTDDEEQVSLTFEFRGSIL